MSAFGETDSPVIDGFEFARGRNCLQGRAPLAQMARLADVLVENAGNLEYSLIGETDREGNAYVVLSVGGELRLRCQRCLRAMAFPLQIRSRLRLMVPGQEWPDEELVEDGFDMIEAGREIALLPLIEEEVLLALPIAPRHESCGVPASVSSEQESTPFAVLAKIKKGV